MAVTNLQERTDPGKAIRCRNVMGNGTPVADPNMADATKFPMGSTYLNLDDGVVYVATDIQTWVAVGAPVEIAT